MIHSTLTELARQLQAKNLSSVELTQLFLDRIDALNGMLNAFTQLNRAQSLTEARAADALRQQGRAGRLTGIPLAHKDIFCQQQWKTTCASRILHNFSAPYDAHLIERCRAAGLVTLGHTNMDEFAMGSSTENSYYGPSKNPWDTRAVTGGSSGGSAAAVAARLAPAATGTDTGGSIRQPAAHCGITGIKPSYGLVSRYGMVAYASSLDQAGVMAKTAEDCALLFNEIIGFDERDSTSLKRPTEDYSRLLSAEGGVMSLTIGLPREYFAAGLDAEVEQVIDRALSELKKLGLETVEIELPHTELSIPAYYVIALAEASSNLSRYDGVRYGHRAQHYSDIVDMYEKTRSEGFGSEVKRRILLGTYVLSHGYYDAYYVKAQQIRRLIANDFNAAFERCDLIIGPVAPTAAFNLGEMADPVQMYLSDIYTLSANLAGLPAMSIPAGLTTQKRPVGLQLIGPYLSEARLLHIAHHFQQHTPWHQYVPEVREQRAEDRSGDHADA